MTTTTTQRIPLKPLAIPNEHGAWGFWLEPALLGLLLAPSWAGAGLALASLGALFMQHPLSLFLTDKRRKRSYARTSITFQLAMAYSLVVFLGFSLAIFQASSLQFLIPLLMAAPLALFQLESKTRHQGRSLWAELAGALAMTALLPSILLLGNVSPAQAAAFGLLLSTRSLPSILYVRARLRLERGEKVNKVLPVIASIMACVVAALLVYTKFAPVAILPVMVILFIRCAMGLSFMRRSMQAKTIGMLELFFGLLLIAAIAFIN